MTELDMWGKEIPICQRATNYPYVQCDCPVHDFVAKLLDIDSTRANGYKSSKTRQHDRDVALLLPSTINTETRAIKQALTKSSRVPIITQPSSPPRKRYKRVRDDGEYIYEMGNSKPVAFIPKDCWDDEHSDSALARIDQTKHPELVWNPQLYTWVDKDGQPFERITDYNTNEERLVYRKDNMVVTRNVATLTPESTEAVARDMLLEMRKAQFEKAATSDRYTKEVKWT